MNYLISDFDDAPETFSVKFRRLQMPDSASTGSSHRKSFGRRRGKSPQQFNGIHRRRNKKIRW